MALGTHDFTPDPRNDAILINVNGVLTPRAQATVSVFDSGFMLGDGVWEGIRVHAVSPGPILTRASSGIASFDDLMANAVAKSPLKRLVTLTAIANPCASLCTDASSGMTGQTIYVDAGCHAMA